MNKEKRFTAKDAKVALRTQRTIFPMRTAPNYLAAPRLVDELSALRAHSVAFASFALKRYFSYYAAIPVPS
jgi:hypothetical protein